MIRTRIVETFIRLAGTLSLAGLTACGVAPAPVAVVEQASPTVAVSTTVPPTATPSATSTAAPTHTPPPTFTATATPEPTATQTPTQAPTATPEPPTNTATSAPTAQPTSPSTADQPNSRYTAYIKAATKPQQEYQYSCEFDAVWVVLNTYGIKRSVNEIIAQTNFDTSIEPRYEEKNGTFTIYGGDIERSFSGNYKTSFLARSTGGAMIPVFEHFSVAATPVSTRESVEAALSRGELVWIKTTVDFKPWRPATWVMPDGRTRQTVLGNDHAVVVIGYNDDVVVIRDVLGPTSSNQQRQTEYEVSWQKFLAAWGAQSFDGLALARP